MTRHLIASIAALALSALTSGGFAQGGATPQSATVQPPPTAKPEPKTPTPQQLRNSATAPGDLRPERPAVPQVNIPLGKDPAKDAPPAPAAARASASASSVIVGDAAARCEAERDAQTRAACRARLARQGVRP